MFSVQQAISPTQGGSPLALLAPRGHIPRRMGRRLAHPASLELTLSQLGLAAALFVPPVLLLHTQHRLGRRLALPVLLEHTMARLEAQAALSVPPALLEHTQRRQVLRLAPPVLLEPTLKALGRAWRGHVFLAQREHTPPLRVAAGPVPAPGARLART